MDRIRQSKKRDGIGAIQSASIVRIMRGQRAHYAGSDPNGT